jgi:hypothetical protein
MNVAAFTLAVLTVLVLPVALPVKAQAKADIHSVDFRNGFVYDIGVGDEPIPVTVKGGTYSRDTEDDKTYFEIQKVVYGDLTGDGKDEAIVQTLLNTGGTGQFTEALLFEFRGGKAELISSLGIGDRADGGVFEVFIRDGKIFDERFGQDHSGACCPEYVETYVYGLRAGKLKPVERATRRAYYSYGFDDSPAPHRVKFLPGTSSVSLAGSTTGGESYVFGAKAGQTVSVRFDSEDPKAEAVVATKAGEIGRASAGRAWAGTLPASGDFTISVRSSTAKDAASTYYELTAEIR